MKQTEKDAIAELEQRKRDAHTQEVNDELERLTGQRHNVEVVSHTVLVWPEDPECTGT